MTLPTSGTLTLQNIATEFGGTAPHNITEYYRGGTYVPNIGVNSAVPTSGAIKIRDFLGAALTSPIAITDQTVSRVSAASTVAQYTVNASGIVQKTLGTATTTIETWLVSGTAGSYEVRATLDSGDTPTGTLGTWQVLSTTRSWSLSSATVNVILTCDLTIEIRLTSTGVVQDIAAITIESEKI